MPDLWLAHPRHGMTATNAAHIERPVLAGGEAYIADVDFGGTRSTDWVPQTYNQARYRLEPQVSTLRERVDLMPANERGGDGRVIVEATILPNFLSGGAYPGTLFERLDVRNVGSRPTRAEYRTR